MALRVQTRPQVFWSITIRMLVDIREKSANFNVQKYIVFKDVAATTYQCKSLNKVIKGALNNKELSLDGLLLALFQFQMNYLNEFNGADRKISGIAIQKPSTNYKFLLNRWRI
jgi:hypothetical protein